MKNKLLLFFIITLFSGFHSQGFGQDITMIVCQNANFSSSYSLTASGTITDDGISRTTYMSDPNVGDFGDMIIIKWNTTLDQWEILFNNFDGGDGPANELQYYSSNATFPNPPNISIGNWITVGEFACDPMVQLTGDVAGINSDPTVTGLPLSITVDEDSNEEPLGISSTLIEDVDAGGGALTLKFDATGGIFDIAAGTGVTLSGNLSNHLEITGNIGDVNHYISVLSNIYFRPDSNLYGNNAASVDVYINDNGNTGTGGGNDIFVGTIIVNITAVNDAPDITVPSSISAIANTDTPLTGISIEDVDAEDGELSVSIGIVAGTLLALPSGGVSVSGSGTNQLSLQGSLSDLNTFLASSNIIFKNEPDNIDDQTLTVSVNDNGNTGGGPLISEDTATIILAQQPAEISSVSVPPSGSYGLGEELDFIVNYNKPVNVNTSSGTPELVLQVGGQAKNVPYMSGSGSTSLVFRYTVVEGDEDDDGVLVETLLLNGGTITNEGVNSSLVLQNIDNTENVMVDAVAPSGYAITIDQDLIHVGNQTEISFTYSNAEVATTYTYIITSLQGGGTVNGTGQVLTSTDQVTGLNLSNLNDGVVSISFMLEDANGNIGIPVVSTISKQTNHAPVASDDHHSLGVNTNHIANVLDNDSDGDGDNIDASLVDSPSNGTIIFNVDGEFNYTPNTDYVGLDSISYKICDDGIPSLCDTAVVYFEVLDTNIPTGYSVAWAEEFINESEANAAAFKVSDATVGATLNYQVSSNGDGNSQIISGSQIVTSVEEDFMVDVSGLQDGTLTTEIFLTSIYGTPGITTSDSNAILDQTAPSGHTVSIDQNPIDRVNQSAVSFTMSSSELEAHYDYTLSSTQGGQDVTGSGVVTSQTQSVTDIDLTNLAQGDITLSLILTDRAGNIGDPVNTTSIKITNEAPTVSDIEVNGSLIITEQLSANYVYADSDGDPESGSTYLWYLSEDSSGAGKSEIPNGTASQYTLKQSDRGKYISIAVTPSDGRDVGTTVESPLVGPVKMVQNITFPSISEKTYGDAPFILGDAQTDQGLAVIYTAADPSLVEINGNQATILKTGTTTITATQEGDDQTSAAEPIAQTLIVNAVLLTIEADNFSKIYGESDPELSVSYSGFINGDDETSLDGSLVVRRAEGESVGDYPISVSGYTSDKYTINYVDGNFDIQPRLLSIIVDPNQNKVYGQDEPQLSYTVQGFSNGDDQGMMQGDLSREPGEDAGLYAIIIGTLNAGNNYELQIEPSEFEILKAEQAIVWNQELTFGCNSDSQVTLLAESNSGLPITYMVEDSSIAEVEGNVLTKLQSGVTTISAQQLGDQNHHAAPEVHKEVQINQQGLIRQHWDDVLVFDNSSENFVSYQWYKNGNAIPGATKQYYSEEQTLNGEYYVVATMENGAQITSCLLEVSQQSVTNTLMVVPNPALGSSEFSIKASFNQEALNGATISLIDLNGRVLQTTAVTGEQTTMIAPSQTGIYIVVMNLSDGKRKTVNLLVQ